MTRYDLTVTVGTDPDGSPRPWASGLGLRAAREWASYCAVGGHADVRVYDRRRRIRFDVAGDGSWSAPVPDERQPLHG